MRFSDWDRVCDIYSVATIVLGLLSLVTPFPPRPLALKGFSSIA